LELGFRVIGFSEGEQFLVKENGKYSGNIPFSK
jgi:hypothetical protein